MAGSGGEVVGSAILVRPFSKCNQQRRTMHAINALSIKAQDFKAFSTCTGFDRILPINLIIGRNNSGKSALLELIASAIRGTPNEGKAAKSMTDSGAISIVAPRIHVHYQVNQKWIGPYFNAASSTDRQDLLNHGPDSQVDFIITQAGEASEFRVGNVNVQQQRAESIIGRFLGNPLKPFILRQLKAERDIVPEDYSGGEFSLEAGGDNCTRIIEKLLHDHNSKPYLVERVLLSELNRIVEPDCSFKRIKTSRAGSWQILLEDESGRAIELAEMGSGLKTILLVLMNTAVLPSLDSAKPLSQWVFTFEELENHLHPAILRRLLAYLVDFVKSNRCTLFLTSHSSVTVDFLSSNESAQIVHVAKEGSWSKVTSVKCRGSSIDAVRDLGAKPSDVLLTNGVVWLEGPSDRIYFNAWVRHFSGGKLREDVHYQCLFLGGSNAANFEFSHEPNTEDVDNLVKALKLNHNAIVLLDRDRPNATDDMKPHVKRIAEECNSNGIYCWITSGREVENYIPHDAWAAVLSGVPVPPNQFASVFEHAAPHKGHASWSNRKADYAHRLVAKFTGEGLDSRLDLKQKMSEVCRRIADWNGVSLD